MESNFNQGLNGFMKYGNNAVSQTKIDIARQTMTDAGKIGPMYDQNFSSKTKYLTQTQQTKPSFKMQIHQEGVSMFDHRKISGQRESGSKWAQHYVQAVKKEQRSGHDSKDPHFEN